MQRQGSRVLGQRHGARGVVRFVCFTLVGVAISLWCAADFGHLAHPTVTAVSRVGPSPTPLSAVSFGAGFSEPVHGIDVSDFVFSTTGTMPNPTITAITTTAPLLDPVLDVRADDEQYANLPAATWFSGDFTIECWVYPRAFGHWARIADFGNGPDAYNVVFAYTAATSGRPSLSIHTGVSINVQAPDPIPLFTWTHVAVTFEGTTGTMFINGQPVATNPAMEVPPDLIRSSNYIGRSNWASDAYADAQFDELRVWDVARSQGQLQAGMHLALDGSEAGLVACYHFNALEDLGVAGDGADDLRDVSPNALHADTVNDPAVTDPTTSPITLVPDQVLDLVEPDQRYVDLPDGIWFDGDLTIECWVCPREFNKWARVVECANGENVDNVLLSYTEATSGRPALNVQTPPLPPSWRRTPSPSTSGRT